MAAPQYEPINIGAEQDMNGVHTIQPAVITEVKNVASFRTIVAGLELFKSVTVVAILQDENGAQLTSRSFTFEGAEYLGWNNDDQYLVNLVAQRLGFTLTA